CEDATEKGATDTMVQQGPRRNVESDRFRSLSPPHPGAVPIKTELFAEVHHLHGKLNRAHHRIQIPMYAIKWILSQILSLISVIFWRVPSTDTDVVECVEGTTLCTVLRRDHEAEAAEKAAFNFLPGVMAKDKTTPSLYETRHYYINVEKCVLDLKIRPVGVTYGSDIGKSNPINSWSMRYNKSRRRSEPNKPLPGAKTLTVAEQQAAIAAAKRGADYNPTPWKMNDKWECKILSFVVNGQAWQNRERMYSLLHHYHSTSVHTKTHIMGNSLVDRILADDRVTEKLAESTWTTTALHHGLLNGTMGPLTHPRNARNQWTGLGCLSTRDSTLAESENLSCLGADHAAKKRWTELDLPFVDFLLDARLALSRVARKNNIPPDLYEAIFLSCIVHATDHILMHRIQWGKVFNMDATDSFRPGTWYDHWESTAWRYMWCEPTLNPFWNNKIRGIRKPFYRQLYKELKKIDTFKVADNITASIMY
ncbi:unnamed protein product, partial [Hapterophycus canaliculatus]